MGGRGAASNLTAVFPSIEEQAYPYIITSFADKRGGATYPFLSDQQRAWHILTHPANDLSDPDPAHTFSRDRNLASPTLRWVNGDKVNDLYVEGMSTEQFLDASGLQLDMHKGGFVLSKRLSRLMRPYFVSGFFETNNVAISYMHQSPEEAKVWDGAGIVSRRMLQKMMLSDSLSPAKREKLEAELRHAQRVEFTIMTAKGQDKGHAIVADNLRDDQGNPVDFLLPEDTKKEVRLENGETFVGINFVHGQNHMRLDIQSLINLHPFFKEEQLLTWLKEEGDLFVSSVETGQIREVMGRIDRHTTLDEVQAWPLREYLASGGHPMWFRSHVRGLMNLHLQRLNHSTLEKLRLPIPGGRHYVMPAAVGRRAGIKGLDIAQGQIQVDTKRGTAWVNETDWVSLTSSTKGEGIASILGGADNDDALWLHPFSDYDGTKKFLAWRSPNQVGEFLLFEPTERSSTFSWHTAADGPDTPPTPAFPPGDSRKLPERVDLSETEYLGLVDPHTAGGLGEGEAYSISIMDAAINRCVANKGALGMYCNALMVNKALYGRLPETPPAPLESIIDSAIKTGADLSQIITWTYANSRHILESKTPMPTLLHKRLSIDWQDDNRPPLPRGNDVTKGQPVHWLNKLEAGIQSHIQNIETRRDELMALAQPPPPVLLCTTHEDDLRLGRGLIQAYKSAFKSGKGEYASVLQRAKAVTSQYLDHFPPKQQENILLGALSSVYSSDEMELDTAVWLSVERNDVEKKSIGSRTIQALQQIGVLDSVIETKEGLVVLPLEWRDGF